MGERAKTEPLIEIFESLDLMFCARALISLSKSSMRDIRVPLSKTSGPAEGGSCRMRGWIGMRVGGFAYR
jgi:hypothetical protein